MRLPPGIWRYIAAFASGVVVAVAVQVVVDALGAADLSLTIDWILGAITGAFAFSLLTGIGLGQPPAVRNARGDAPRLVNVAVGARLALFAVAVIFVGPLIGALVT